MSEHFTDQNNAKLSSLVENLECYEEELADNVCIDDLSNSYDHMYATNHEENGLTDDPQSTRQATKSEVNFLKEFLLIHLDLIQQQNDDILNKENTIFILQQENSRLRERLRCMESGSPCQSGSNFSAKKSSESSPDSFAEDMTLDSGLVENNNAESLVQTPETDCQRTGQILSAQSAESEPAAKDNQFFDDGKSKRLSSTSPVQTLNNKTDVILNFKQEPDELCIRSDRSPDHISNFGILPNSDLSFSNSSYTVLSNSLSGSDPMRNLKMSIRRKRLCSTSSAVSNNDSMSDDKRNFRRSRKKRKRIVKNDHIHTYNKQYVTQVGNQLLDVLRRQELADEVARATSASNLEVPRWRVKVYTSCYAMEGTENLEDEVFLRRHNRLENDERRRKRWDVQRIREQRIVEKLKQRQDRKETRDRSDDRCETIESLWPSMDDIKYIEMCDVLPVSAFGCPVPKIQPSEFNLPWLVNPNIKKTTTRRSTGRRRGSKR